MQNNVITNSRWMSRCGWQQLLCSIIIIVLVQINIVLILFFLNSSLQAKVIIDIDVSCMRIIIIKKKLNPACWETTLPVPIWTTPLLAYNDADACYVMCSHATYPTNSSVVVCIDRALIYYYIQSSLAQYWSYYCCLIQCLDIKFLRREWENKASSHYAFI